MSNGKGRSHIPDNVAWLMTRKKKGGKDGNMLQVAQMREDEHPVYLMMTLDA